jgi:hypothetical protein
MEPDNRNVFLPPNIIYLSASLPSSHAHPMLYPQHQPGIMMYSSPHHDIQYNPSVNHQVDVNGWYYHSNNNSYNPYHPPGLPAPPPPLPLAPPVPQQTPTEEMTAASSFADILQLDDFWRGRLAPLPGYQSRHGLVPMNETKRIQIGIPTEMTEESSSPLPARSLYQKNVMTHKSPNNTQVSSSATYHSSS